MKKLHILIIALFTMSFIEAQNITYDLRCSGDGTTLELWITRDIAPAAPFTNAGASRVTLVFPTDGGTRTVSHTNEGVNNYSGNTPIINPGTNGNDYHYFFANGGASLIGQLQAGVPTLWMTFSPSDGVSQNVRLFEDGVDPESGDSGMGGIDASNVFSTISISGAVDEYASNVSGDINCGDLGLEDTLLANVGLFPNPTKDSFYIEGLLETVTLSVYDLKGRLILTEPDYLNTAVDISKLKSAIYLVKLSSDNGSKTIKLLKE